MSYTEQLDDLIQELNEMGKSISKAELPLLDRIDHTRNRYSQFAVVKNNEIIALSLEKMELTKIPRSIYGMNNLKSLNLGENLINEIPDWMPLLSLTHLYLHYNKIDGNLSSKLSIRFLEVLDIAGNNITNIDLSKCTNLKLLYLHTNNFSSIPKLPSSLIYLNLSRNNISELGYLDLPSLIDLKIDDNLITIIPDEIHSLTNLEELHCRNNAIELVSEMISELKNLRILNLRENNLSSLPKPMNLLLKLISLDLRANNFYTLPLWIYSMNSLKADFRWNKLDRTDLKYINESIILYY